MKKLIAITGATGFVGRKIAELNLAEGRLVHYLTRHDAKPISQASPTIGDVNSSREQLQPFLNGCGLLINCAAELHDQAKMFDTHVQGTINLLHIIKGSRKHSEEDFHWIQLSSCGAYGVSAYGDQEIIIDENSANNPQNEYELTKTKADELIIEFAKNNSWFKYTIIRPTIVFGSGMRSTALLQIIRLVKRGLFFYISTKESIANYVHVDDVVNAIGASVSNERAYNEIFIVSNDCRFKDLLNAIASELRVLPPLLVINKKILQYFTKAIGLFFNSPIKKEQMDALSRRVRFSSRKIKDKLGWRPSAPVPEQIKQYVNLLNE